MTGGRAAGAARGETLMGKKKKTKTLSDIIAARRERLILRGELWSLLLRTAVLVLAGGLLFTHVFLSPKTAGWACSPPSRTAI